MVKVLGAQAKDAKSEADLQKALDDYKAAVEGVLTMSDEQKTAWSVIGGINGTNWDTDIAMTKVSEGVYESAALQLNAGEEFKVRQGASWDVNFGSDGFNGANIVVETTGTYKVHLEWDGAQTGTVTIVPVEG